MSFLEQDYEQNPAKAQREARDSLIAANEAFTAAMNRAIKKGKERVKAGTFVDDTPPINALRFRPSLLNSGCGSPSALCMGAGE